MKLLMRYFRLAPSSMPAAYGNDNDARLRKIAEVRRMLAEIAVDPPACDRCPEQDVSGPAPDRLARPGGPAYSAAMAGTSARGRQSISTSRT